MDNDIQIKEVTEFSHEIAQAVRYLVGQLDEHFQELSDEDLQSILLSKDIHLLVAKDGEKIVGMITLATYRIPYKKKGWLEDLVVDESARGKGIGSKLVHAGTQLAKKKGLKAVDLTSQPTREEANKLYERLGFEKRGTHVYRVKL
ncbi:hypothetical protein BH11PAT1_BH11PAT1_7570 [soil metagenome]